MQNGFRSWSDVRVFLAVVREGSTLAASRQLGIAQPTVARRVEALEQEIGLVLFARDTRGFRPTEVALSLVPLAEAMEAAASDLAARATELTSRRPIRITAFSGNFSPRVTQIFGEFSALRPDVAFEFLAGVRVFDLSAGEADVALRLTLCEPDQTLICRKISTARFTLYGSRSYAEEKGLPKSPNNMRGHSFVTFQRADVPPRFHDWLLRYVSADQIVTSCSEVALTEAAIKSGRALGIMNLRMAEADEMLVPCFDPPQELSMQHLLLVSPDAYRRPEVKAFTKFFLRRVMPLFSSNRALLGTWAKQLSANPAITT